MFTNHVYISKVKLVTLVEDDPKSSFFPSLQHGGVRDGAASFP